MNPQRISFLFGLCWFIGFVAFTSLPPRYDSGNGLQGNETVLSQELTKAVDIRISSELPKTPPFKVDWSLIHRLNTPWIAEEISFNEAYFAPSFFQKSISRFDVRETFLHFFFSW